MQSVRPAEPIRYGQPVYPPYGSSSSSAGMSNGVPMRCQDEQGFSRNVGDYWVENHRFNKTCRANGAVEVVNCVSKDGYRIPLNVSELKELMNGGKCFCLGPVDPGWCQVQVRN